MGSDQEEKEDIEDEWVRARVRKCFGEHGTFDEEVVGEGSVQQQCLTPSPTVS